MRGTHHRRCAREGLTEVYDALWIGSVASSRALYVFIGMESLDTTNLADVNENFSKPDEYMAVLNQDKLQVRLCYTSPSIYQFF